MINSNSYNKLFSMIILYAGCSGLLPVAAQNQQLDSIVKSFNRYRETVVQEKLYVHLDRTVLLTGETLWFKIYNVDATFHKPLGLSKVAYIEVLDKANKSVLQAKISLNDNGGDGSLFIPATLPSGNYIVRAYTQWMRNFDPAFYFHNTVTIINPFIKPDVDLAEKAPVNKTVVNFFPEGGYLVDGLKSKIAFKISKENGEAVVGQVTLIDPDNDTIAVQGSNKFGLGNFYLTPHGGEYKVIVNDNTGQRSAHKFPAVQGRGYVMELRDSSAQWVKVKVSSSGFNDNALRYAYLMVHSRQVIIHAEVKPVYPKDAVFLVNKNNLPEGISHFTVFNEAKEPVCERLFFTVPANPLAIDVVVDQKQYGTRRKVSLQLSTTVLKQSTPAHLSVSVFKTDSLSSIETSGIHEHLLLSSDLKGKIDNPEYYFNSNDPTVTEAADNLMLTHGWRRFNWNDVISSKSTLKFLPEYHGHIITGKVMNKEGEAASGIITYLSSPGKIIRLFSTRSNAVGVVQFDTKDFLGARKLILSTNFKKDSTYKLQIESPFSTTSINYPLPAFSLQSKAKKELITRSVAMQVQDIYNGEITEQIKKVFIDSTAFYGKANQTYYLDDYTRFPVLEEVMREYVPGVLVRKRRDGFHFIVIDSKKGGMLADDPLVLLDGVPIFDLNKFMTFNPLQIKKLEVVMNKFYHGPLMASGIVSYTTYTGDLNGFQLDQKMLSIDFDGVQRQREFYSPQYNNNKLRNSRIPDQRNLLLWSPNITTDKNGSHQIEFYTSDLQGSYRIVVEGITNSGIAGSASSVFSVKRTDL